MERLGPNHLLVSDGAEHVWVGAHDMIAEGVFEWINGERVQQLPWSPNEPSNGSSENCLVMEDDWVGNFYDRSCSTKYEFFCQIFV